MKETRVVDTDTGGAKGQKMAQMSAAPASVFLELLEHYGKGRAKYPDTNGVPNYSLGYAWSLSFDAAMRHLLQFWSGEDCDPETGSKHVIAAAWHCITLAMNMERHPEKDDRWERKPKAFLVTDATDPQAFEQLLVNYQQHVDKSVRHS